MIRFYLPWHRLQVFWICLFSFSVTLVSDNVCVQVSAEKSFPLIPEQFIRNKWKKNPVIFGSGGTNLLLELNQYTLTLLVANIVLDSKRKFESTAYHQLRYSASYRNGVIRRFVHSTQASDGSWSAILVTRRVDARPRRLGASDDGRWQSNFAISTDSPGTYLVWKSLVKNN